MMDKDKDGILGKEDLRATWDQVGKLASDKDLEDMLAEAPGPVNFTQLLSLFATRMAGGKLQQSLYFELYNFFKIFFINYLLNTGADDDQTVREAFLAFDEKGKIDSNK